MQGPLKLSRVPHTLLVLVGHTLPGVGFAHVAAQRRAKFEPALAELTLKRQIAWVADLGRLLRRCNPVGGGLRAFGALTFLDLGKIRIQFCLRFLNRGFQGRVCAIARRCVIHLRRDHEHAVVGGGERVRVGLGAPLGPL